MRSVTALPFAAFLFASFLGVLAAPSASNRTIVKDVAIVGGGAAGTYAAVRLREDYNISVVVIEANDHLGGHVNTYVDPVSNTSINYGVQAYSTYGNSKAFFNRFEIPTTPSKNAVLNTTYIDISTGKQLTSFTPPSFTAITTAIQTWANLISKYDSFVLPGLWSFPTGNSIPEELLTPFGTIAASYNLTAAIPIIASISNVGVGGINDVLTLYVMQAFGTPIAGDFLNSTLFVPANASNSLLYQRAQALLGSDVLYSSQVNSTARDDSGASLLVQSPEGRLTIQAKLILFTPPPDAAKMSAFDLDAVEQSVLSTWTPTYSFVGIAHLPNLPSGSALDFYAPSAEGSNYRNIRNWPFTMTVTSTGPAGENLFRVLIASNFSATHEKAKYIVEQELKLVAKEGPLGTSVADGFEWRAFVDHNSILGRQSVEMLQEGFVQKLYGLQGRRAMWYSGGLWTEDYTGNVWAFTDSLLPKLLSDLADT